MDFLGDFNLRFPHISEQIFDNLDDESLAQCREVSTSMCDFIDNTKIPWKRIIKKYMQNNCNDSDGGGRYNDSVYRCGCRDSPPPVSYTHLTLPTIYSV